MANLDSIKSFKTDKSVTVAKINANIKRQLDKKCKYHVEAEHDGVLNVGGRVKEAILNPMVTFSVTFTTTIEDDKAEIQVGGQTGFTWIFWLLCTVGFLVIVPPFVAYFLYLIQKDKPQKAIDQIVDSVSAEYSVR